MTLVFLTLALIFLVFCVVMARDEPRDGTFRSANDFVRRRWQIAAGVFALLFLFILIGVS